MEAVFDFLQLFDALHLVHSGAAYRADRLHAEPAWTFDHHVRDAQICLTRDTAFEAEKFCQAAFTLPGLLAGGQEADEFTSPDKKWALVPVCLQPLLQPAQHGVLVHFKQRCYLLHGIWPRRLNQADIVLSLALRHGSRHRVQTLLRLTCTRAAIQPSISLSSQPTALGPRLTGLGKLASLMRA